MKISTRYAFMWMLVLAVGFLCVVISSKRLRVNETIAYAKNLKSEERQIEYLMNLGEMYLKNKDYLQAREVAEYIIYNFEGNTHDAYHILEICRKELKRG